MDKEKMIQDLYNLDLSLSKEEKEELDSNIRDKERIINIFSHLKNNSLILLLLTILSILSFNSFNSFNVLLLTQSLLIVALLFSYLIFRKKHYYHTMVLMGMKESAEEFRHDLINSIRNGLFD
jgi:hypothetical protein